MNHLKTIIQWFKTTITNIYYRHKALQLHDEAAKIVRRKTNPYQNR